MLWVGIVGIFVCVLIVAANTPHAGPPSKAAVAPAGGSPDPAPHAHS
jgi:hypothetical protein